MSEAIEALSEYKYLLESMGHDAQSTGPYMRCLDAIAALQAMQGDMPNIIIGDGSEIQMRPAVPEGYVPVPRAAVTEVLRISDRQHPAWDAVKAALLSAAKETK